MLGVVVGVALMLGVVDGDGDTEAGGEFDGVTFGGSEAVDVQLVEDDALAALVEDGVVEGEADVDGDGAGGCEGEWLGVTDGSAASWPTARFAPHASADCKVTDRAQPLMSTLALSSAPSTGPHTIAAAADMRRPVAEHAEAEGDPGPPKIWPMYCPPTTIQLEKSPSAAGAITDVGNPDGAATKAALPKRVSVK